MRRHALAFVALVLLLAAQTASAEDYCVNTGTQIAVALALANQSAGAHIKLKAGITYSRPGSEITASIDGTRSLAISGGWNADCTRQTQDASLTTLSGDGVRRALHLESLAAHTGSIRIENLRLADGYSATDGGCLLVKGHALNDRNKIVVERAIFEGCVAMQSGGGAEIESSGNVTFHGNLLHLNKASIGSGLELSTATGAKYYVTHNTLTDNLGTNTLRGAGLYVIAYGDVTIANNILWGNLLSNGSHLDIHADAPPSDFAHLYNNVYGVALGRVWAPQGLGNLTVDPGFASDSYRLKPGSPAIDYGSATFPASALAVSPFDLDGRARVHGAHADAGAYEYVGDAIFKNGFDSNVP